MVAVLGITSISGDQQYERALEEFGRLMALSPKIGTPERDRYDALAAMLEAYEAENYPIELPDPADAILVYLDEEGKSTDSLLPLLGTMEDIHAILERRRDLTLDEIRALHEGLGIPAEVLIRKPSPPEPVAA